MKNILLKKSLYSVAAFLIAISAGQTFAADYQSTVQSFNPLAYWRFNETAVSPALNIVTNYGSVGSAGNGYVVLDAAKGQPGKVGSSIRFTNPGNSVGYCGSKVDVPFNAALNPTAPFSVEFWAKPNSLGVDSTGSSPLSSLDGNESGGASRVGWLFYLNSGGRWQFRLGFASGTYAIQLNASGGTASVGTWQHIVVTYDGTTANIYVDGVLRGSGAPLDGWVPNAQNALRFGGNSITGTLGDGPGIAASANCGNRGFDGWLDEVAIYATALSASTIAAHHDAATTNTTGYGTQIFADSPRGYWNCDEPTVASPDPSTFPTVANSGSVGSSADGTSQWGVLAAQEGAGYTGFGAGNKACFFDSVNGYVALPDPAGLHFEGQITMMAWIKPQVKDFFRNIIAHGWDENYQETFLRISRGDDGSGGSPGSGINYYEVGVSDGTQAGYNDNVARYSIPDGDIGNWVFLAGTHDGANWNLYRNGMLVASTASENGALDVATPWSIGSRAGPPSPTSFFVADLDQVFAAAGLFFGGSIDEPAIFNTSLSASDINTIYNAALVPPVITQAPQAPTPPFYSGSSASFSVWAEGSPTLSYLWSTNDVSTGVTTTNLTLNNLPAGTFSVAVIVTNSYGSATGSVTFPVVASKPLIVKQPQPVTRFTGFPFSFSIAGGGSTPLSYQWKTNDVDIAGATASSYSGIASAASAVNYSCTLSNEFGTSNSVPVALTVLPIPGGFPGSVIAGPSDPPLAYWRLGESSGTTAGDYIGGHDGTYFNVTLGETGFSVLDSDTAVAFSGSPNSYVGNISGTEIDFSGHTNFTLEAWVNGPAGQTDESTIIAKGSGNSGTSGTEQFSIDVVGGNYRFFTRGGSDTIYEADAATGPDGTWQHVVGVYDDTAGEMRIYVNGVQQGSGAPRPPGLRVSSAAVTIGSKHLGNDPDFDGGFSGTIDEVAVYNYALSASTIQTHYAAAYGSSFPPTISKQPVPLTNYVSLQARFSVGAYGTQPLSYQWKRNGGNLTDGGSVSGSSTAALTIYPLVSNDAGDYSVTINNSVGPATNSAIAKLTVLEAPTSPPATPDLVLHLPFDNNLTDITGRGNDGTSINRTTTTSNTAPATYVSDGKLNQGLHYSSDMGSFPGPTTTNNFYVTLGVRPDLQFSSNVSFTVAYWIRLPENYTGGDLPFFTDTPGSTFGSGFVFAPSYGPTATSSDAGTDPGGWAASFYDTIGNGAGFYGDVGSINDGGWHHLVHVNDRTKLVTYLDGVQANATRVQGTSVAAAGDVDSSPPNPVSIGQDPTGTYGESGSGDIDDLGVWRRALTPLEAAAIYVAATINGLSFTNTPTAVTITIENLVTQIRLTWPTGTLESADSLTSQFSTVMDQGVPATSPYKTTPIGAKFYRVKL